MSDKHHPWDCLICGANHPPSSPHQPGEVTRLREALREIDKLASVPLGPDGPVGTLADIRRLIRVRLGDTPDE